MLTLTGLATLCQSRATSELRARIASLSGMLLYVGFTVGVYDGALGPGTGSFMVFALVGLLGYGFLQASAKAKIANWATNLAALIVFIPLGAVMWKVGLLMGLCNMLGAYLGARTAVARGSGFVRPLFLVVVAAVVSIVARIALPSFQESVIRARAVSAVGG